MKFRRRPTLTTASQRPRVAGAVTGPCARTLAWFAAILIATVATALATGSEARADTDRSGLSKRTFALSATAPLLEVDPVPDVVVGNRSLIITGTTDPHGGVLVDDRWYGADSQGNFALSVDDPTVGSVTISAVNVFGVTTSTTLRWETGPSRVALGDYRAVHVGFCGWADSATRQRILAMVDEGRINAIQLDLKDEEGLVAYGTQVPLARTIGATESSCVYDLASAVADLHARDVAVIGRIVAFADPILASWAWDEGNRDWVVQTAEGDFFRGHYTGFTNLAHPEVIAYNLDIATEAAQLGVDHILWDYLRRPEGRISSMQFPGLSTSPEEGIVDFVRQADQRLARWGVQHGASVFGIATLSPTSVAQDIPRMAEHLDYVAPMLYPSHWGPGHFGLSDPVRDPYTVIYESLALFEAAVDGKRAQVIPWLEDTPYRAWDRPLQVREQLEATYDRGINSWLLWNPGNHYTPSAIDPFHERSSNG